VNCKVSHTHAVTTGKNPMLYISFCCIFQGGLVFICGTADGLIKVSGRRHNADDLKATILAVDPIKFVYRGR
jgi:hypothetical protein